VSETNGLDGLVIFQQHEGFGMYHEERVIDGKLFWRSLPNGQWVEYTNEQLTRKLQEAQQKKTSADFYEKAPWWTNPDLPPLKVTC